MNGRSARRSRSGASGARAALVVAVALIPASAIGGLACSAAQTPVGYVGDDARSFVREHRAELEQEIVTGSGPRIYDLAILADCQDVPQLSRELHRHENDFFSPDAGGKAGDGSARVGESSTASAVESSAGAVRAAVRLPDEEVADRVVRFMEERREFRCLNLDRTRRSKWVAGRREIGPSRSATTARGGTP